MKRIHLSTAAPPVQPPHPGGRATTRHLGTYLNDHLAGSVTAIKLLTRLESTCPDDLSPLVREIRNEIEQDRCELTELMQRLHVKQSRGRMAMGWLGQKLTAFKLKLDDPRNHGLRALEILEIVEVGIEGKRGLWQALAAASDHAPTLRGPDYQSLTERARKQHDRVESARLASACTALVLPSS